MKVLIQGTLDELSQLYEWETLSELVHVDYYRRGLVPDTETFTVTELDLLRVGVIFKQPSQGESND